MLYCCLLPSAFIYIIGNDLPPIKEIELKHRAIGACLAELEGRGVGFPASALYESKKPVEHRMKVSSPFGTQGASQRNWCGTQRRGSVNPSSLS